MKIKYEMIKREIAGETYLVPVGEAAHKYSGLFAMTDVGAFIWDKLPEASDEKEVLDAVLEEYDVDYETAKADVEEFLCRLREIGLI